MQKPTSVSAKALKDLFTRLISDLPSDITDKSIMDLLRDPFFGSRYHDFFIPSIPDKKLIAKIISAETAAVVTREGCYLLTANYCHDLSNCGDSRITDENFPAPEGKKGSEVTIRLHKSEEGDSTEKVIQDMARVGLRQVDIWELEALRLGYPKAEWRLSIVALGSTLDVNGTKFVPRTGGNASNQGLRLCSSEVGWSPKNCRIAGVEI